MAGPRQVSGNLRDDAPHEVLGFSVSHRALAVAHLCMLRDALDDAVFAGLHADGMAACDLPPAAADLDEEHAEARAVGAGHRRGHRQMATGVMEGFGLGAFSW
jgi:hypothetical protein